MKNQTDKFISEMDKVITVRTTVELTLSQYCGNKIREIRKTQGINQQELADLAGMLRSTLSNIEGGKVTITIEHLYALCKVLKCKATDIIPF